MGYFLFENFFEIVDYFDYYQHTCSVNLKTH